MVCAECGQNIRGVCVRRNAGMCGLNDYFPMIVGTIERVLKTDPGCGGLILPAEKCCIKPDRMIVVPL